MRTISQPQKKLPLKYTILLFALALVYVWVGPKIEQRFHIELPGLPREQVTRGDSQESDGSGPPADGEFSAPIDAEQLDELLVDLDIGETVAGADGNDDQQTRVAIADGPLGELDTAGTKQATVSASQTTAKGRTPTKSASQSPASKSNPQPKSDNSNRNTTSGRGKESVASSNPKKNSKPLPRVATPPPPKPRAKAPPKLELGDLKEVGRDRFESAAGILYTPGSAEGHRLDHLMRHTKDDPSRPVHGVFDGGRDGALKTIDRAYLLVLQAKLKGGKTKYRERKEGDRTVLVVEMGRRIGFVGGQKGKRLRKPAVTKVQIVLEDGNRLITAYPTDRL